MEATIILYQIYELNITMQKKFCLNKVFKKPLHYYLCINVFFTFNYCTYKNTL
jgi:hypothetical protein